MSRRHCPGPAPLHAERFDQAAGLLAGLSPKQQQAIAHLLGGCSFADAARRAGVSRGTLYQWRRDEKFLAALESWRGDMEQATRSRLLALSGMGLKAIHRALESGDAKTAVSLFRGLGILAPSPESKPRDVVILRRAVDRGGGDADRKAPAP